MDLKSSRNKKKRRNPLAKFIAITVMVLVMVIAVFYVIDNPSIFNKIKGYFLGSDQENQETVEEEVIIEEEQIEPLEITEEGNTDQEQSNWWNRILAIIRPGEEDGEGAAYPKQVTLALYFMGLGEDDKLVGEEATIIAGDPKTAVINATRELLKGPKRAYHIPVIPGGTELIEVEVYENLAKIDLSQEFLENSLDSNIFDRQVIYSIVNTLTEIPSIKGVIFYIEGKRIKVYGNVDLSIPAIRDESILFKENSPEEEIPTESDI